MRNLNIITTIQRIQEFGSIMCGYFCTRFIDFMLKDKTLLHFANLFSPNDYKRNDKAILKYFPQNLNKLIWTMMVAINTENLKRT